MNNKTRIINKPKYSKWLLIIFFTTISAFNKDSLSMLKQANDQINDSEPITKLVIPTQDQVKRFLELCAFEPGSKALKLFFIPEEMPFLYIRPEALTCFLRPKIQASLSNRLKILANAKNENGCSALLLACINNETSLACQIAEFCNKETLDAPCIENGPTPLMFACQKANTEIMSTLLSNQADPNKAMLDGQELITPLNLCCKKIFLEGIALLGRYRATIDPESLKTTKRLGLEKYLGLQTIDSESSKDEEKLELKEPLDLQNINPKSSNTTKYLDLEDLTCQENTNSESFKTSERHGL